MGMQLYNVDFLNLITCNSHQQLERVESIFYFREMNL